MKIKCVKSNCIFTPQNFVETLTGRYYIFEQNNTIEEIHKYLKLNGIENDTDRTLWDYPLEEIEEIVKNKVSVVLVDTSYINDNCELVPEYRWFEVPDDIFLEGEDEDV